MTTMQDNQWVDYPIASLDSYHAPFEFTIPPHTEFYTDLSQTFLYMKYKILKENSDNLAGTSKVSLEQSVPQYVQWY